MVTINDLKLDDGTFMVPKDIYDRDENVTRHQGKNESEDDYRMRMEIEKSMVEQARNDERYKGAKHEPFIDDVKINSRRFRALIVPATQKEYEDFIREEDREQKSEAYYRRCPIADGKGGFKQCPRRIKNPEFGKVPGATKTIVNRCDTCDRYRAWKNEAKSESMESMAYNDEGEERDRSEFGREMLNRSELSDRVRDIVLEVVMDKHSRYYEAVKAMLDNNLSVNAASAEAGINNSGFDKALKNALGRDILEALAADPFTDIQKLLH